MNLKLFICGSQSLHILIYLLFLKHCSKLNWWSYHISGTCTSLAAYHLRHFQWRHFLPHPISLYLRSAFCLHHHLTILVPRSYHLQHFFVENIPRHQNHLFGILLPKSSSFTVAFSLPRFLKFKTILYNHTKFTKEKGEEIINFLFFIKKQDELWITMHISLDQETKAGQILFHKCGKKKCRQVINEVVPPSLENTSSSPSSMKLDTWESFQLDLHHMILLYPKWRKHKQKPHIKGAINYTKEYTPAAT